jgi:hypothetical protein
MTNAHHVLYKWGFSKEELGSPKGSADPNPLLAKRCCAPLSPTPSPMLLKERYKTVRMGSLDLKAQGSDRSI